ncbi:MAG: GtrA family protein [Oscillospiraceae bacterium]
MREKIEKLWNSSVVRFIIVGVINTLVGSAIMFGLYNLVHCSYWFSSAANYTLTSILSFFLNKYFTFRDTEKSVSQTLRFVLNIVVCYGIAYGDSGQRGHVHRHGAFHLLQLRGPAVFRLPQKAGNRLNQRY